MAHTSTGISLIVRVGQAYVRITYVLDQRIVALYPLQRAGEVPTYTDLFGAAATNDRNSFSLESNMAEERFPNLIRRVCSEYKGSPPDIRGIPVLLWRTALLHWIV